MFGVSSNFVDFLGRRGFRGFIRFAGLIRPWASGKLLRTIGKLGYLVGSKEYNVLDSQLEFAKRSAPALGSVSSPDLFCSVFEHLGRSIAEISDFSRPGGVEYHGSTSDFFNFNVEAEGTADVLKDVIDKKCPGLLISGHIGNFELLAAWLIRSGIPITILGREPNYPFLSRWLEDLRTNYGADAVFRSKDSGSKRDVGVTFVRSFKKNKSVGVLLDQDTNLESEFAPFFSLDAAHPVAPIRLAMRSNIRMFTTFIVRTAPGKHKIFTEEIFYDAQDPGAARHILTVYSQRLQKLVEQYPEQYLWIHRRWRRRPGIIYGENATGPMRTAEYVNWMRAQVPVTEGQIL